MGRDSLPGAILRKNRIIPAVLACLLLSNIAFLLVMNLVYEPENEEIRRKHLIRIDEARRREKRIADAVGPWKVHREAEKDLRSFHALIPSLSQFTLLIEEVFSRADSAGLEIRKISYSPELVNEKRILRYALSFSISGEYLKIKAFLYSLEQSPRIITIENLSMNRGKDDARESLVHLNLRMSTFFKAGSS